MRDFITRQSILINSGVSLPDIERAALAHDPAAYTILGLVSEFGLDGRAINHEDANNFFSSAVRMGWGNVAVLQAGSLESLGRQTESIEVVRSAASAGFPAPVNWLTDHGYASAGAVRQTAQNDQAAETIGNLLGIAALIYLGYEGGKNSYQPSAPIPYSVPSRAPTIPAPGARIGPAIVNTQPQPPKVLADPKSCQSDYSCRGGERCVKAPFKSSGICVASVNEYGSRQYEAPRGESINIPVEGQCSFDTECPVSFRCDRQYRVCIQR